MQMAVNMARMRYVSMYASLVENRSIGSVAAIKLKNPALLLPALPLAWICGFNMIWHMETIKSCSKGSWQILMKMEIGR